MARTDARMNMLDATLTQQLKVRAQSAKLEVLIAGDKDVPLQELLRAMDVARAAGVEDLGIAAKP